MDNSADHSFLAALRDELEYREQEAYRILFDMAYSEEQVTALCQRIDKKNSEGLPPFGMLEKLKLEGKFTEFVKQTFAGIPLDYTAAKEKGPKLHEHDFYAATFYASLAACLSRSLQERLPPPGDFDVTAEYMAEFALSVSNATLCLTEAGWKPAVRCAEQGLKYKSTQSKIAKNTRRCPVLQAILERLAKRPGWHNKTTALWDEMILTMANESMEPEETGNRNRTSTWKVTYIPEGGEEKDRKPLTFGTFKNNISDLRK